MQISKVLTNKTALAMAAGLVVAGTIGFSTPAQAHGYYGGCSTCHVVKYRYYKDCGCGYKCCYHHCYNSCNYQNYSCRYGSCGYYGDGYYYGGYYY